MDQRSGVSRQWQEAKQEEKEQGGFHSQQLCPHQEKKKVPGPPAPAAPRGLLRHCVETRERGAEELQQREVQQLDFRSLLGR